MNFSKKAGGAADPKNAPARFAISRDLPVHNSLATVDIYLNKVNLLWDIITISLVLDLALVLSQIRMPTQLASTKDLESVLLAAVCLGILVSFREALIDLYLYLRHKQEEFLATGKSKYSWLLIAVLAISGMIEIFTKVGVSGLLPIVISLAIFGVWIFLTYRDIQKHVEKNIQIQQHKSIWLENVNQHIFFLIVIPLVLIRSISLLATAQVVTTGSGVYAFFFYFAVTLFLLLELQPSKELFVMPCKRCSSWTSRALKQQGYCPACARELFSGTDFQFEEMSS